MDNDAMKNLRNAWEVYYKLPIVQSIVHYNDNIISVEDVVNEINDNDMNITERNVVEAAKNGVATNMIKVIGKVAEVYTADMADIKTQSLINDAQSLINDAQSLINPDIFITAANVVNGQQEFSVSPNKTVGAYIMRLNDKTNCWVNEGQVQGGGSITKNRRSRIAKTRNHKSKNRMTKKHINGKKRGTRVKSMR